MTQDTINQIIAGTCAILVAVLPILIQRRSAKKRNPNAAPPNPWRWVAISGFLCGLAALLISLRSLPPPPPLPTDIIRANDRISFKYRLNQGGHAVPGFIGVTPPTKYGEKADVNVAPTAGDNEIFQVYKH